MIINSGEQLDIMYQNCSEISYYSLNDPQSQLVEETPLDFNNLLKQHLDLSQKKQFYLKDKQIYKIISTKFNEFLLKMGFIGFIYINNQEKDMILRDILSWENVIINNQQTLQIKLRPGEDFLGLISTKKEGQVQFNIQSHPKIYDQFLD